jgi:uncharacterized SAM-dependent methyltransferase
LELHQAYSPSRTDRNCAECYDHAFAAAAKILRANPAATHLIGLGCGGGEKDSRLLRLLKSDSLPVYSPVDVSTAMVMVAHGAASPFASQSLPLVCDLSSADDLASIFTGQTPAEAGRVITFFGMMPNFEPQTVLPRVRELLRPGDVLLLSANLAPGRNYAAGVNKILPLYDNRLTNTWLITFLLDIGVEETDGVLQWQTEPCPSGHDLLRVTAWFQFIQSRSVRVAGEAFAFRAGEKLRLFFSYRYTTERLRDQLSRHGLRIQEQWISSSEEEGVFLCGAS